MSSKENLKKIRLYLIRDCQTNFGSKLGQLVEF